DERNAVSVALELDCVIKDDFVAQGPVKGKFPLEIGHFDSHRPEPGQQEAFFSCGPGFTYVSRMRRTSPTFIQFSSRSYRLPWRCATLLILRVSRSSWT